MKINKVETRDAIYRINDRMDNYGESKIIITEIEECEKEDSKLGTTIHGIGLYYNRKVIAFIPYHAVQCIFYEVFPDD